MGAAIFWQEMWYRARSARPVNQMCQKKIIFRKNWLESELRPKHDTCEKMGLSGARS
jgi:hypothetical protein